MNADKMSLLEKYIESIVQDDKFSGCVLITKGEKEYFKGSYGYACKAFNVPNNIDTQFNIASVGKIFTGVAIAQLVENQRLNFDDTIDKFISEDWLPHKFSKQIQIRHLLTHTSGLDDYFEALYAQPYASIFRDMEDYRTLFANIKINSSPGSGWSYSSAGYLLLGVIIQNVTGCSYFGYIQNNIFNHAEMEHTNFLDTDIPVTNRATGYYKDGEIYRANTVKPIQRGNPSGGCYSTVHDLNKFGSSLMNYRLLKRELTQYVISPKNELGSPFYGYGFAIDQNKVGHVGDGRGISAHFSIYQKQGYIVSILSNYSPPSAGDLAEFIEKYVIV